MINVFEYYKSICEENKPSGVYLAPYTVATALGGTLCNCSNPAINTRYAIQEAQIPIEEYYKPFNIKE